MRRLTVAMNRAAASARRVPWSPASYFTRSMPFHLQEQYFLIARTILDMKHT
jgi:hypothetical protein